MLGPNLPLRALVVFEASGRLGSFRAAALELGLTPSAVSHQIRRLEAATGVRLFERAGRGVVLSPAGREFSESLRDGFDILRRATAALAGRRAGRDAEIVRLQTPPSFASRWLLPRLPGLLERHPALDIRVTAEGSGDFDLSSSDLAIVYGDERRWQERALPLLDERIQPLCAPARAVDGAIQTPCDLLAQPLIATRINLLSWKEWFRRQGVAFDPHRLRIIELDPSDVGIEAATKGLGVILESDLLAEEELGDGRLIAPLPGLATTSRSYWLAPRQPSGRPGIELLSRWLLETAVRRPVVR